MNNKLKELVGKIKSSDITMDKKIADLLQLSELAWSEGDIDAYSELGTEALALGKQHYPDLFSKTEKETADGMFSRFLTKERIGRMNFQLPDIDLDEE